MTSLAHAPRCGAVATSRSPRRRPSHPSRARAARPGKSAGPGLRTDLVIDALADPDGIAPARYIGLWPDAGLCLGVDGTMEDLRAGARDLVRTAVVQRRARPRRAA